MWFKNLRVYRMPAYWTMTAAQIITALQTRAYAPLQGLETVTKGWVPPVPGFDLVYSAGRQMLICLCTEKKLLPASVINAALKEKLAEVTEQLGYKPGKKQRKEIKEQVIDELLPQAFSTTTMTHAWIDPINGWLVVNAGSRGRADDVVSMLIKCFEKLPLETLHVARSLTATMTDWLATDEAPADFTVDQDAELQSTGESKATVRYTRHTLNAEDLLRHIKAGKQCTKLALTWNDRVSFVMHEDFSIKRVAALDVLKENQQQAADEIERFDADFTLMTGELNGLLSSLLKAFGGEVRADEGHAAA
jgi:recombination associated protein RdgC